MSKVADGLLEAIGDVHVKYVYGVSYIFDNTCGYLFHLASDIKESDDVPKHIGRERTTEERLEQYKSRMESKSNHQFCLLICICK